MATNFPSRNFLILKYRGLEVNKLRRFWKNDGDDSNNNKTIRCTTAITKKKKLGRVTENHTRISGKFHGAGSRIVAQGAPQALAGSTSPS